MKRVISLWLPKFATDRLCKLRPDWLDSPLGLVWENGGRLVLHAVNDLAEQAGIRADMTLADARAILPDLKTSEADIPAETNALSRLADWCGRYTPWTAADEEGSGGAYAGGGSIWLDVTGCAHLFGGEEALMLDAVERARARLFVAQQEPKAHAFVQRGTIVGQVKARESLRQSRPLCTIQRGQTRLAGHPSIRGIEGRRCSVELRKLLILGMRHSPRRAEAHEHSR